MLALALLALWVRPAVATPAEPSPAEAASRDATAMFQAFIRGDLDAFAEFTYPAVVAMAGGKPAMKAILEKGLADMRAQGFSFRSVSVDKPTQVLKAGDELHALLPMLIVIRTPQGDMHVPSYLLGVSQNKGKAWTFVDTNKLQDQPTLHRLFPRYNKALKIPPKKQTWIVPAK
jgi:hypothetical protein